MAAVTKSKKAGALQQRICQKLDRSPRLSRRLHVVKSAIFEAKVPEIKNVFTTNYVSTSRGVKRADWVFVLEESGSHFIFGISFVLFAPV